MQKNRLHWLLGLSTLVTLFLLGLILYPSVVYTDMFSVVCVYVVIDTVVFIVGYSILRKLDTLAFWKFIAYLAAVIGASVAINSVLYEAASEFFAFFIFTVFMILTSLNFVLWRTLFAISLRRACLIAMLIGLVNSLVCIAATPICK